MKEIIEIAEKKAKNGVNNSKFPNQNTNEEVKNMGWLKDYPDFRDFTVHTNTVSEKLIALGTKKSVKKMLDEVGLKNSDQELSIPTNIDLSAWFSPIEDQGALGSCTSNAAVGILEYFERRAFRKHIDASRLFLYKVCRKLLGWTGDTGCYIRTTLGGMALFGVPQEKYYPYTIANYDTEPSSFAYALAQNFQALTYYRLDPTGTSTSTLLDSIKNHAAAGIPSIFGFVVYSNSMRQANSNGGSFPMPISTDSVAGGHAVVIAGYDDNKVITNSLNGISTKGAFIIRNSWGASWGTGGYGYLPYDYVLKGLAVDFWVLLKNEWIDSQQFGL